MDGGENASVVLARAAAMPPTFAALCSMPALRPLALAAMLAAGAAVPAASAAAQPLPTGQPLRVAVAANFQAAFGKVAASYSRPLAASYGSSGLLYAQIVQGRPFDAFLSADRARPQALLNADLALDPIVYASGRLALLTHRGRAGPAWLTQHKRVAAANSQTAPYGQAASEALARLGVDVQRITALNVAQAFHFAASGAADGAFVAYAQVLAQETPAERYWIVPGHLHSPIEQVAVVVRGGNEEAAQAFLRHLASDGAQTLIRAAGYR